MRWPRPPTGSHPGGEDLLAVDPLLDAPLRELATQVLSLPSTAAWEQPLDRAHQVQVQLPSAGPSGSGADPASDLRRWGIQMRETERDLARANMRCRSLHECTAAEWWSTPPPWLRSTTGIDARGVPHGLLHIEDGCGDKQAATRAVVVPKGGIRVLELATEHDWTELCRRHTLDVSRTMRATWGETTGRDGPWVIPDWQSAAQEYDAVHLSIAGYLRLAGRALPIDATRASVVAGWDPDRTYWLHPVAFPEGPSRIWRLKSADQGSDQWRPGTP